MSASRLQLRRILFSYAVNELGTWLGYVALTVAVYGHTGSAIATAAFFVAGRFLPAPLVTPLVARMETSGLRAQLSLLYTVEAVATLGLALATWHFSLPVVLVLAALDGTAALAANALLRTAAASVGERVPLRPEQARDGHAANGDGDDGDARRRAANARMNLVLGVAAAVGPAIAGVTVAATGSTTALTIDAASFMACAALLARLHAPARDPAATVRTHLAEALQHVSHVTRLRGLLLCEAGAFVFFTTVGPVEVIYAKRTLHAGDVGYGLLLALWGVGMIVGGLVFARGRRLPLGLLVVGGALAVGCAYLGMGVAPTLAVACCAAVVGGVGNGVQWASAISAVQQMTPPRLLARVMAVVEGIGSLCPAAGYVIGGVVAATVTPRAAFLVAGGGAALASLALARLARKGFSGNHEPTDPTGRDLVAT